MKVLGVANPRKPSKVAAVSPPRAAVGCCSSSSQVTDSVKERLPEWRTTTPLAGRCHRPDCTIQRTWDAPKSPLASRVRRTVGCSRGTFAGWSRHHVDASMVGIGCGNQTPTSAVDGAVRVSDGRGRSSMGAPNVATATLDAPKRSERRISGPSKVPPRSPPNAAVRRSRGSRRAERRTRHRGRTPMRARHRRFRRARTRSRSPRSRLARQAVTR